MKPKSTLRSFLAIAGSSLLAISYTHAATLYWDGNDTTANADGGIGNWDNALTNWDTLIGSGSNSVWGAGDTAVFGGAANTVTLTDNVTVGGLQFNTNSYIIDGETNTKSVTFANGNNSILLGMNGVTAATINGQVAGSASANVSLSNAAGYYTNSIATLTLGLTSTSGWAGTTTINAGTTLSLSGANRGLASTSGITLNGGFATVAFNGQQTGGILLANTNATQAAFNRVNDSAGIVSNGGFITVTNTASATTVYSETMGSLDLRRGQLNVTATNANTADVATQTLTFGNNSLTNVNGGARTNATTSAINFSGGSLGVNVRNTIKITSQADTNANEIIAPWATAGTVAGGQTDYAVYNRAGSAGAINTLGIQAANITATDQSLWATTYAATNNYTLTNASGSGANGRFSATRNINSLRNTTAAGGAITVSIGTDFVTLAGNAFANGDVVVLSATAGGLTAGVPYYVRDYNGDAANGFKLSATQGGAAIDITALNTSTITGGVTLSSGNNLNTYGILNGGNATQVIGGAGTVSTPSGGGNLYLTTGGTSNTSHIAVNSAITDNGGAVTVVKNGAGGALFLSGNNTFTGGLVVNASGQFNNGVVLQGAQSFTGGITLNGGSINNNAGSGPALGATAAALNGNAITVNGAGTLLVADNQTLATTSTITINPNAVLTLGSSSGVTVPGVVSGSGLLDMGMANINSGSTVNLTNTANTFTGNVAYANQHGGTLHLSVASIGDTGKVTFGLGNGTTTQIFSLNSSATTGLTFNTRQFELAGSTATSNRISNNSPGQTFTINTDLLTSGTGSKTLTLQGGSAALSTFAGKLVNGSFTSVGITKDGTGTWALTNSANSYTAATTLTAGTLRVSTLANGGSNSNIGASTNAAGNLILNGGTLQYTGAAVSTDRNFAIAASSTIDASGSGAVNFTQLGTVSPDQNLTANFATGQKVVTGLSSTADMVVGMRVTGTGIAASSTIASIDSSSQITLNNNTTAPGTGVSLSFGYTASARTLTLTGTNTGANTIAGSLKDTTAVTAGVLSLTKSGVGTWTLGGTNTYTGITTVSGGRLVLDYGASNTSKLSDTVSTLTLGAAVTGGVFVPAVLELKGGSHVEEVFSTTLPVGTASSVIQTGGGSSILRMNAITFGLGSAIDFAAASIASTSTANNATGILNPGATINGTDWAINSGILEGSGNNFITAYTGYVPYTRTDSGTQIIVDDGTKNIRVTDGSGSAANITLAATTTNTNTINQSATGGTVTIDAASKTLRTNGILMGSTAGALTIGTSAGSGTLTSTAATGNIIVTNNSANTLTINSVIVNNTTTGLVKNGTGVLVLTGTSTYTGGTTLHDGTIRAGASTVGTSNGILGSTNNNGIIIANKSTALFDVNGYYVAVKDLIGGGALGGNVTLGSGTLYIGNAANSANPYAGIISGTNGNLIINGSSSWNTTSAHTYTGTTTIGTGSVTLITNNLQDGGIASGMGASNSAASNLVFTGGTLRYSSSFATSTNRQFTVGGNAGLGVGGAGAITWSNTAAVTYSGAGTRTLFLSGDGTGLGTLAADIDNNASDAVSITKTGTSNWMLTNAGSAFTGAITLNTTTSSAGTLSYASAGGANAITFNQTTSTATLSYIGSTDKTMTGLIQANALSTGAITLDSSGAGAVNYSNTGSLGVGGAIGAKGLVLSGTNTGNNTLAALWENNTATGAATLTKNGTGAWTLTASHTYTGATTINAGTLTITGATLSTTAITVGASGRLGLGILTPVTASSAAVTLSGSVQVSGTPTLASYTLLTASSITGTPVLSPAIPGYTLVVDGGNTLKLNAIGGPVGFAAWQAANSTAGARGDDHDNDGVDNGTEHFLGGTANTTGFTALPGVTNTLGTLSVTWTKAASYSGLYTTDFVVETSATLAAPWAAIATSGTPNVANTVHISGNNVTYTFPAGTKNFARLKVTGP